MIFQNWSLQYKVEQHLRNLVKILSAVKLSSFNFKFEVGNPN